MRRDQRAFSSNRYALGTDKSNKFLFPEWLKDSIYNCVRLGAGRSKVRLSAGSYQDVVNWYFSLLARRTVCRRAARNTSRTQNELRQMKAGIVPTQSWRYKTTVVIMRHQQKQHIIKSIIYNFNIFINSKILPRICCLSTPAWSTTVVPNLFSVMDPFDDLAETCGPLNKTSVQAVYSRKGYPLLFLWRTKNHECFMEPIHCVTFKLFKAEISKGWANLFYGGPHWKLYWYRGPHILHLFPDVPIDV